MTTKDLLRRYTAFAVIATILNLLAQRLSLSIYDGAASVEIAIGVGTLVGLVVKYILDKVWIFDDRRTGTATHAKLFGLYTLMGVATTAVFWGTEYTFWLIWETHLMREVGGVIGLAIGYVIKYPLDKRFVFGTGAASDAKSV
ncbi:GtrA family protein [Aestuariibius insulae]|uniref:GtrA family protein n=1 Tax=Aestuariibius insulae TaxID=2058287 RepID=UPI00345E61EB